MWRSSRISKVGTKSTTKPYIDPPRTDRFSSPKRNTVPSNKVVTDNVEAWSSGKLTGGLGRTRQKPACGARLGFAVSRDEMRWKEKRKNSNFLVAVKRGECSRGSCSSSLPRKRDSPRFNRESDDRSSTIRNKSAPVLAFTCKRFVENYFFSEMFNFFRFLST